MPIGYQFQPDEEKRLRRNINQPAQGQLSPGVSEAIKVLSLRLPNVLGGRPMAPDDLLRPQMGGHGNLSSMTGSLLGGGQSSSPPETGGGGPAAFSSPTANPFSIVQPPSGGGMSGSGGTIDEGGSTPAPTITPGGGSRTNEPGIPETPAGTSAPTGSENPLHHVLEFLLNRRPERGK